MKLSENSRECVAFLTPDGRFTWKMMPQGAKNAANFWAGMISEIFAVLINNGSIIVYQDDIVNPTKEFTDHMGTQGNIYKTLIKNNFGEVWPNNWFRHIFGQFVKNQKYQANL